MTEGNETSTKCKTGGAIMACVSHNVSTTCSWGGSWRVLIHRAATIFTQQSWEEPDDQLNPEPGDSLCVSHQGHCSLWTLLYIWILCHLTEVQHLVLACIIFSILQSAEFFLVHSCSRCCFLWDCHSWLCTSDLAVVLWSWETPHAIVFFSKSLNVFVPTSARSALYCLPLFIIF